VVKPQPISWPTDGSRGTDCRSKVGSNRDPVKMVIDETNCITEIDTNESRGSLRSGDAAPASAAIGKGAQTLRQHRLDTVH
jgi:hypothetical protein